MEKLIYIGMASKSVDRSGPAQSVGEDLRSTVIVGVQFTRVFKEACRLAGISEPEVGYRTVINRLREEGHAQVFRRNDRTAGASFTQVRRV